MAAPVQVHGLRRIVFGVERQADKTQVRLRRDFEIERLFQLLHHLVREGTPQTSLQLVYINDSTVTLPVMKRESGLGWSSVSSTVPPGAVMSCVGLGTVWEGLPI
jgi:hypothetical protein